MDFKYVRIQGRELSTDTGYAAGIFSMCWKLIQEDVTFDLDGLDYLSSAGLRVLFATYKLMAKRGGAMRVSHVGESVMDVLATSGFADIFAIEQ